MTRGFVIAGAASGSGKTTLTLAVLAALAARGYRLAPFKVGPDFIDPGHHSRVAGVTSRNLDGWMLSRDYNRSLFARCTREADLAVVEGVMGLFDGYDGRSEAGSTAQMAKWLDLPVVLVVDARSMARSAAALVRGFESFDPDVRFAGVVFNRIGSPTHLTYLEQALDGHVGMPCLGGVPRRPEVAIPERHLGLHTAEDHLLEPEAVHRLAELAERHVAIDRLIARLGVSQPAPTLPAEAAEPTGERVRIGVARDAAFCFYYPDNLELLAAQGAEIVAFSPLRDSRLPEELDGLVLGGGYPELHAAALAANRSLREAIGEASDAGMPVYAECGGFMYLCAQLIDSEGQSHPMVGRFPFATRMLPQRKALGYRDIRLVGPSPLGPGGLSARGHEFHYSELLPGQEKVETVYETRPRAGGEGSAEGYRIGNTLGSYIHLHFGSNPDMAVHFAAACRHFRKERTRRP